MWETKSVEEENNQFFYLGQIEITATSFKPDNASPERVDLYSDNLYVNPFVLLVFVFLDPSHTTSTSNVLS